MMSENERAEVWIEQSGTALKTKNDLFMLVGKHAVSRIWKSAAKENYIHTLCFQLSQPRRQTQCGHCGKDDMNLVVH